MKLYKLLSQLYPVWWLWQMGESVERACQQVEGEDVECVCGGTCIGADSSMLQCDSCKGWYAVAISFLSSLNLCTN
jgi:hypothetical protein